MIQFHPEARGAAQKYAHAIDKYCPAVLTTNRGASASRKYQIFPTMAVITDLQKSSWLPVEILGHPKNAYARHLVRFRHVESGGDEWPEIVVVNSHDGLSSFQLTSGIFRLVCSNGLVAAQTIASAIRVRHVIGNFGKYENGIADTIAALPEVMRRVTLMKARTLKGTEKWLLANDAIKLRWPKDHRKATPETLLVPTREADNGDDVWRVLNVVQEKLLSGGLDLNSGLRSRRLSSVERVVKLNQAIFERAFAFCDSKAA